MFMKNVNGKLREGVLQPRRWFVMALLLLIATTGWSKLQSNKPITIKKNNITVVQAFDMIKQQAGVSIVYQDDVINKSLRLNLNLEDASLAAALEAVCRPAELEYSLRDNYVLIKKRVVKMIVKKSPVAAQQGTSSNHRVVSGTVVDEKGEPLIGVNVALVGSRFGAITDNNGHFQIEAPEKAKLSFSYVGMAGRTINIGRETHLTVTLKEDVSLMNEVVVTGYQQIDRRNLTSSVTSVKMEDIDLPGITNLDKMLEGRIPDMVVMNNSGEINSVPQIRIRGTSTLIGNRSPLWVLDGIVLNDPVNLTADVLNDPDYINRIGNAISGINPQDIDRIDVLKDAAATALYGTRAANGVIVVTTKKGRIGKPIVSYSFNGSYRRRPRYSDHKMNLMNSKERIDISRELYQSHYKYPSDMSLVGYEAAAEKFYSGQYTQSEFESEVAKMETMNTDWFKILCQDSFSQDHSLNVSGGNDKLRYYASVGYSDESDVIKKNSNRRYTGTSNFDFIISPKFQLSFNLNAYNSKRDYNQGSLSPVDYAYKTSRAIPAYNDDGSLYYYNRKTYNIGSKPYSFINEIDNSYTKQVTTGISATLNLRSQITDWLYANAIFSYSNSNSNIEGYWGEQTFYALKLRLSQYGDVAPDNSLMPYGGELSERTTRSQTYTGRFQLNFNKTFAEKHNFNIALGAEMSSNKYDGYSELNRGFYLDRGKKFTTYVPSNYSTYYNWLSTNMPTITDSRTNMLSAYTTVSYSFKNMFTLNANTRFDGSNKFGSRSKEKILPIWSVSGLINLKEMTNIKADWLDELTLKSSYGEQGNMLDSQASVMWIKKGTMNTYYNEMTSSVAAFANPDLRWEKTHSFNAGLELSVLKSRFMMSLEYYYKRTDDAFMNKPISDINGYDSYVVNSGTLTNKGYNVSLTATPFRSRDLSWIISGSLSKILNSIDSYPGKDYYGIDAFLNGTAVVKGKPVSTFYSYKFEGLNPKDGGPLFDDWEERCSELVGLSKYDTFTKVLVATGKREPDISGSINNTIRYKSWRLGILMNYSLGAKVRLFKVFGQDADGSSSGTIYPEFNLNRVLLDRWKKPGDELHTNIPAIIAPSSSSYTDYNVHYTSGTGNVKLIKLAEDSWNMYDYSDLRTVSANYLRIANVSLTYELPQRFLDYMKITRFAVTFSASNLHTFCAKALRGQAPTQGGFSSVQLSDVPIYTLGVNLQF